MQESDYQVVKVRAKNYSNRIVLNRDILPHKNIPNDANAGRYYFMTKDEDPLALPPNLENDLVCSQVCSASTDIATNPSDHTVQLDVDRDVDNTSDANRSEMILQLVDRSTLTDPIIKCSVAVQNTVELANKHSQTSSQTTDLLHITTPACSPSGSIATG